PFLQCSTLTVLLFGAAPLNFIDLPRFDNRPHLFRGRAAAHHADGTDRHCSIDRVDDWLQKTNAMPTYPYGCSASASKLTLRWVDTRPIMLISTTNQLDADHPCCVPQRGDPRNVYAKRKIRLV